MAVRRYDWGSHDQIPRILGIEPTSEPFAEYWLGAHSSDPATIDGTRLDELIAHNPSMIGSTAQLEFDGRLPYMLKLLSAGRPLSLQAHPNRREALEGFNQENTTEVALDAKNRTYKDPWDKPELLVALTEFDALVGFRDPKLTVALFDALNVTEILEPLIAPLRRRDPAAALAQVFLDCLILDDERSEILTTVVSAAVNHVDAAGELGVFARTAVLLDQHFPHDPSLLAALLLNYQRLQPGQALHIRPGYLHAYLHGTGVEIMGNSDNVLRGGLTNKHIDPSALVQVVNFEPCEIPLLEPTCESSGLWHYNAHEASFALWRLELLPGNTIELPAESSGRILLTTRGELGASTGMDGLELPQGKACFINAGESVRVSGDGQGFLAATGMDAW